jgi:hypothetical protein
MDVLAHCMCPIISSECLNWRFPKHASAVNIGRIVQHSKCIQGTSETQYQDTLCFLRIMYGMLVRDARLRYLGCREALKLDVIRNERHYGLIYVSAVAGH